jgi:hypothetical protein
MRSGQNKKNIGITVKNWSGVLAGRHLWSHTPMSSSECKLSTLLSLLRFIRTLRIGNLLFPLGMKFTMVLLDNIKSPLKDSTVMERR